MKKRVRVYKPQGRMPNVQLSKAQEGTEVVADNVIRSRFAPEYSEYSDIRNQNYSARKKLKDYEKSWEYSKTLPTEADSISYIDSEDHRDILNLLIGSDFYVENEEDEGITYDKDHKQTYNVSKFKGKENPYEYETIPTPWSEAEDAQQQGDAFRNWVNEKYPEKAKEWDLAPTGSPDNDWTRSAYYELGEEYEMDNVNPLPLRPLERIDTEISKELEPVSVQPLPKKDTGPGTVVMPGSTTEVKRLPNGTYYTVQRPAPGPTRRIGFANQKGGEALQRFIPRAQAGMQQPGMEQQVNPQQQQQQMQQQMMQLIEQALMGGADPRAVYNKLAKQLQGQVDPKMINQMVSMVVDKVKESMIPNPQEDVAAMQGSMLEPQGNGMNMPSQNQMMTDQIMSEDMNESYLMDSAGAPPMVQKGGLISKRKFISNVLKLAKKQMGGPDNAKGTQKASIRDTAQFDRESVKTDFMAGVKEASTIANIKNQAEQQYDMMMQQQQDQQMQMQAQFGGYVDDNLKKFCGGGIRKAQAGTSVGTEFIGNSIPAGFNPNAGVDKRFIENFSTRVISPGLQGTDTYYEGPSGEGEVREQLDDNWRYTNPKTYTNANLNNSTSVRFDGNIRDHEKMLKQLNRRNFLGARGFRGSGWKTGLNDEEIQEFKDENPFFKKGRVREINYDLTKSEPTKSVHYNEPNTYRFQVGGQRRDPIVGETWDTWYTSNGSTPGFAPNNTVWNGSEWVSDYDPDDGDITDQSNESVEEKEKRIQERIRRQQLKDGVRGYTPEGKPIYPGIFDKRATGRRRGFRDLYPFNKAVDYIGSYGEMSNARLNGQPYTGGIDNEDLIRSEVTKSGLFGRPKEWTNYYTEDYIIDPDRPNLPSSQESNIGNAAVQGAHLGPNSRGRINRGTWNQMDVEQQRDAIDAGYKTPKQGGMFERMKWKMQQGTQRDPNKGDGNVFQNMMWKMRQGRPEQAQEGGLTKYQIDGEVQLSEDYETPAWQNAFQNIDAPTNLDAPVQPYQYEVNENMGGPGTPFNDEIAVDAKRKDMYNVDFESGVQQFNALANIGIGALERKFDDVPREKWLNEQLNADNLYGSTRKRKLGDWDQLGNFRPDQQGFRGVAQSGGQMPTEGAEVYMSEEEIQRFISEGGELEFI